MLLSVGEGNVNCGRCCGASGGFARSVLLATVAMTAFLLYRVFSFGSFFLVYFPIGRRELGVNARVFGHYCDYRVVVTGCIVNMDSGMGASRCWDSIVMVGDGKIIFVVGEAGIQVLDKGGTVGVSG